MVLTIAYRDKPDEVLYSFSKAGDCVCIGRDKRQCAITLGVNAQGVSRVHIKLELQPNGLLLAKDMSTFGTGYDGGPFVVEKEKELKPGMVLQIGSSFFIIRKDEDKPKCMEKEDASKDSSLRSVEAASRKRTAPRKTVIVVEECDIKRRKRKESEADKIAPEIVDPEEEISGDVKDRKLATKLGKETRNLKGSKLDHNRKAVADFLLSSDDEDDDVRHRPGTSKMPVMDKANSSSVKGSSSSKRSLLKSESSDDSSCDEVHDTFADTSFSPERTEQDSMEDMFEDGKNDTILAGAEKDGIVDDIDVDKLSKPLFSSTQLTSPPMHPKKSVSEASSTKGRSARFCDDSRFSDLFESQEVNEPVAKKRRGRPPKANNVSKQKVSATGLNSWLGKKNTAKKRNSQSDDNSDTDEMLVDTKRMKMEVVKEVNETNEEDKREETNMEPEKNVDEDDPLLGMDIETLRMKLRKAVQFEDLERPVLSENRSQFSATSSHSAGDSAGPNYKRFRKAAQGSYNVDEVLRSARTQHLQHQQIMGVTDLIDSRELA